MKKFYWVEIDEDITGDMSHIETSAEIVRAENVKEIQDELIQSLGCHLLAFRCRKATFRERMQYRRNHK